MRIVREVMKVSSNDENLNYQFEKKNILKFYWPPRRIITFASATLALLISISCSHLNIAMRWPRICRGARRSILRRRLCQLHMLLSLLHELLELLSRVFWELVISALQAVNCRLENCLLAGPLPTNIVFIGNNWRGLWHGSLVSDDTAKPLLLRALLHHAAFGKYFLFRL